MVDGGWSTGGSTGYDLTVSKTSRGGRNCRLVSIIVGVLLSRITGVAGIIVVGVNVGFLVVDSALTISPSSGRLFLASSATSACSWWCLIGFWSRCY